jgi:hypothetical protein
MRVKMRMRTRKALEEKREDDRMIGATDEGHV